MRITIPRWVQLMLIPVAILLVVYFSRAASHAVWVFLVSTIVALLLNPLVLLMRRVKIPRWLAVPVVYLAFVAAVVILVIFLGPPLVGQFQNCSMPSRLAQCAQRSSGRSRSLAGHTGHRSQPSVQHTRHH